MEDFSYVLKFIMIGDTGVGKTCLLLNFIEGRFKHSHDLTIGVEYGAKVLALKKENTNVKLQIWDTAGQESFRSITRSYYRGAAAAIMVYDVTSRTSFENIIRWLREARETGNDTMEVLLVGNKIDLKDKRVVSTEDGQKFAKENGLMFIETSAKTSHNVVDAFHDVSQKIYQNIKQNVYDMSDEVCGVKESVMRRTKFRQNTFGDLDDPAPQNKRKKGRCKC
mmetsp:Transcript_13552/g.15016  ORF Transcript_13552/g.15016 Transcript_13552/m.15016 type:complete len:223 (-) Transcript_13552:182-850(-)|eukprot:CAMPEP_0115032020 /NCGR_PEP_ID=MMETSP0216-20121206/38906_1 /TAXON_ID=223996 /ORGANISM="Protocruzia adherens, Strain Boccale" /LENGTH=222 /DNA_ID=CAMNT_0002409833 /DNA_START=23 /DNA_END=694 /DNA_ORIENTATION=-